MKNANICKAVKPNEYVYITHYEERFVQYVLVQNFENIVLTKAQ